MSIYSIVTNFISSFQRDANNPRLKELIAENEQLKQQLIKAQKQQAKKIAAVSDEQYHVGYRKGYEKGGADGRAQGRFVAMGKVELVQESVKKLESALSKLTAPDASSE